MSENSMADDSAQTTESGDAIRWMKVPELVEVLGIGPSRIHRLIEEHVLPASRMHGAWMVPAPFMRDGAVLPELRGTMLVLLDAGYTDDEAVDWLITPEESLGTSPVEALRQNRKAEVRRVAQALG